MDGLRCNGNEHSLNSCTYGLFEDCSHSEGSGVVCSDGSDDSDAEELTTGKPSSLIGQVCH